MSELRNAFGIRPIYPILRFADIRFQNIARAPVTAHGLIFLILLITIHGACTARVRAGLGQVMHCPECPSVSRSM